MLQMLVPRGSNHSAVFQYFCEYYKKHYSHRGHIFDRPFNTIVDDTYLTLGGTAERPYCVSRRYGGYDLIHYNSDRILIGELKC